MKDLNSAYRPKIWEEVKGQDAVVKLLNAQVKSGHGLSNGYIFAGASGCGKTTVARLLFKCLTLGVDANGNPPVDNEDWKVDLIEVNASEKNGIDDIREIIKDVQYTPMNKAKGILLDECHMLSKAAWNCLLKPIEDASESTFFMLCTTEPTKIPKTIQTRCQMYKMGAIAQDKIVERLKEIVDETKIAVSDEGLQTIARNSNDNLRQAVNVLEKYSVTGNIEDIISEQINLDFLKALSTDSLRSLWLTFIGWNKDNKHPDLDTYLNSLKFDLTNLLKLKMGIRPWLSPEQAKVYKAYADKIDDAKLSKMTELVLEMQEKVSGVWDYQSLFLIVLLKYKKI